MNIKWSIKYGGLLMVAALFASAAPGLNAADNNAATPRTNTRPGDPSVVGEDVALVTHAPNVPPPITRKTPAKVIVTLEVKEVVRRLADGVDYIFWTFGGDVPGGFIRIREGDEVEFHLNNHQENKM